MLPSPFKSNSRLRLEAMRFFASVIMLLLAASGCEKVEKMHPPDLSGRIIKVVATTGMVADLVKNIGGERVEVTALMGPGVDPHMYKASERGVIHMSESDVVFYSGLHLEGALNRRGGFPDVPPGGGEAQ